MKLFIDRKNRQKRDLERDRNDTNIIRRDGEEHIQYRTKEEIGQINIVNFNQMAHLVLTTDYAPIYEPITKISTCSRESGLFSMTHGPEFFEKEIQFTKYLESIEPNTSSQSTTLLGFFRDPHTNLVPDFSDNIEDPINFLDKQLMDGKEYVILLRDPAINDMNENGLLMMHGLFVDPDPDPRESRIGVIGNRTGYNINDVFYIDKDAFYDMPTIVNKLNELPELTADDQLLDSFPGVQRLRECSTVQQFLQEDPLLTLKSGSTSDNCWIPTKAIMISSYFYSYLVKVAIQQESPNYTPRHNPMGFMLRPKAVLELIKSTQVQQLHSDMLTRFCWATANGYNDSCPLVLSSKNLLPTVAACTILNAKQKKFDDFKKK